MQLHVGRRHPRGHLGVRGDSSPTAVDVGGDEVDLLAALVRHHRIVSGPRIGAQDDPVAEHKARDGGPGFSCMRNSKLREEPFQRCVSLAVLEREAPSQLQGWLQHLWADGLGTRRTGVGQRSPGQRSRGRRKTSVDSGLRNSAAFTFASALLQRMATAFCIFFRFHLPLWSQATWGEGDGPPCCFPGPLFRQGHGPLAVTLRLPVPG